VSTREGEPPPTVGQKADIENTRRQSPSLGAALRQAWVGYQRQLDEEMAVAGFSDRRFPDGRVLHLCAQREIVTASDIGRELGMTRQGAGKIVAALQDRGYITLRSSSGDRREKVLRLTPRARAYLDAQRAATRKIERDLRKQMGVMGFESLITLLDALSGEDPPRMREYLRRALRDSNDQ
jgi:DNA-binding MarR family transcriptional regulator